MRLAILATLLSFSLPLHAQTTWYVEVGAGGDGSASAPFSTIQAALVAASDLDAVEVAPGTYFEHLDFLGKTLRVYASGGPADTIVDGAGSGLVARFTQGEGAATELVGLTLQSGGGVPINLTGGSVGTTGAGGVLCIGTSPTFENCVIRAHGNPGDFPNYPLIGAGAVLVDSDAQFIGCEFSANVAQMSGGAVSIHGNSSPHFEDTDFIGNRTDYSYANELGGAVCSLVDATSLPTFMDCRFISNVGGSGGALYGRARVEASTFSSNEGNLGGAVHAVPEVHGCVFDNNRGIPTPLQADSYGGAAFGSSLWDCTFSTNRADHGGAVVQCDVYVSSFVANEALVLSGNNYIPRGGAALDSNLFECTLDGNSCSEGGPPILSAGGGLHGGSATRCLIRNNTADTGGGAVEALLDHCTVVENIGRYETGGVQGGALENSIVWGNVPAELDTVSVNYSCTEASATGTGNLHVPPRMWTSARLVDVALKPDSPCIDAADPASPLDTDGSRADMGALPFDPSHVGTPTSYGLAKLSSAGCPPLIFATGDYSLAAGQSFDVEVTNVVPDKFGWIFWSTGFTEVPLLGGTLGLAPPFVRGAPVHTGSGGGACSGSFAVTFQTAAFDQLGFAPYTSIFFQGFYRDPAAPDGTSAGLSNALEIVLLP